MNSTSPLAITCFGPMQVLVDGQPLPRLRSRKALWLLALLTLRHNRTVEREWLTGALWPDMNQSQGASSLRPVLSELRQALGAQSARLESPTRSTLLLHLEETEADVIAFDAAVASRKPALLEQAVTLYQGPLLEGCAEEWVYQERSIRERGCLQSLQILAEARLTLGDHDAAAQRYRQAAAIDPHWDPAQRGLMEALAQSGDLEAALQVYRQFIETLKSDPAALPDEKTTALYSKLRKEARQRASAPMSAAPAKPAAKAVFGSLPHPQTDLVGREDERVDVAAKLRRSRLTTLTGLGGIGKTRLAIEVASEVAAEFPDGVWLIGLESLTEGRLVAPQIAATLGLREETERTTLETLTDHLRKKRLLLVLDNCEHVLAATAQAAGHLLRECAGLRVLATSREALGVTGEAAWTVPSLATPDPDHLPQGRAALVRVLLGYESVQLFVERAQSAQPNFAVMGGNAMTIARISSQLEGIPLAIELAAAHTRTLSVEQIEARLRDHLGLLTGGSRTALSRQQTLRGTMDWSYALLDNWERLLLSRLSVFVGGWTREAAEAVCAGGEIDGDQISRLLTSLTEKSLITFEERLKDEYGRYRLMELVRQYSGAKLHASGETEQLYKRHGEWCAAFAESAEAHLRGADQELWRRRLETEHSNLRVALDRNAENPQGTEIDLRLTAALWRFWDLQGDYQEGRRRFEQALARTDAAEFPALHARALIGATTLAHRQGDPSAEHALDSSDTDATHSSETISASG